MALRTPPSWLQNGSHPAENDRLTAQAIYATTGVIGTALGTILQVTAQTVPDATVKVAPGWTAIVGTTQANMGTYVAYNDASTNLTITANSSGNPRIDRIVATVNDSYYSGVTNNVTFTVVAGTPAVSPTAPATPANSISLATIAVANGFTTIVAGNITDTRVLTTSNLPLLSIAGGTLTGSLTAPGLTLTGALTAGTNTNAPLKFTSGTNLTTVSGGAVEYDGTVTYSTPKSTATNTTNGGRALLPATHFYSSIADLNLTAASTATQPVFNLATGLAVSSSTTYELDVQIVYQYTVSSGTVTATLQAGSSSVSAGTLLQIDYTSNTTGLTTGSAISTIQGTGIAGSAVVCAGGSVATFYGVARIKGLLRTNSAGSYMPYLTFGATTFSAPVVKAGSYMKLTPIGTSTVTTIGAFA